MSGSERVEPLLRVERLVKQLPYKDGLAKKYTLAVDDVSFTLNRGETLGIVGESGSGKSTLGRSVLRLIEPTSGEVWFEDVNLTKLSPKELRKVRRNFQMVFQDPYASLNPRQKIGDTISEPLKIHRLAKTRHELEGKVNELLDRVGLPADYANRYSHELSGGQRQRIGLARAIAVSPQLIVFDEAVSALDVSIQAQILNLIKDLQEQLQLSYLFITHDLSVVRHVATHIAVMNKGKIVEMAKADDLLSQPRHPYTQSLLSSVPIVNRSRTQNQDKR